MPLPGLYPPFVTSVTSGGTTLTVIEGLEVEYSLVEERDVEFSTIIEYDVEYSSVSEVGP